MANNRIKFDIGFNVNKSNLDTLTTALKNIQKEAEKARISGTLTQELKNAGTAAKQLEGILNQAWNSKLGQLDLTRVNTQIKNTYGSVSQLKSQLEASGAAGAAAYNKFASTILNTNIQIKQSNKFLNEMATTLGNTLRYGISSRIVNNLVSSIEQAYGYTKKLDTSLNDIRIVTGLSAENMEEFARQANEASSKLGASTLDYTNAALIYYQQGLSNAEVAARAETTIKAANVTGQTGEEVSEQLTAVWNGYKVTAEETEAYVDKLAAVAATTAADLEELSVGMSKVASAANAMGVDFDDLNAQIATIVSVTRQAPESVGTALKTIYARLDDLKVDGIDEFGVSLGEVSGQLQTMGIQILDQQGNLRDMTSVISEVAVKWDSWTEAQRQAAAVAMAGKRQYNNLIALFDNWDMYTSALNTSINALGTLQNQQDIYMESTAAHLKVLRAETEKTYDILFDQNTVNGFTDALTNTLKIFNQFIESVGGGTSAFMALGSIVSNVFSQQISGVIAQVLNNSELVKQNMANLQAQIEQLQQPSSTVGLGPTQIAANEAEVERIKALYEARKGLTAEQYQEAVLQQQRIADVEKEAAIIKDTAEKNSASYAVMQVYLNEENEKYQHQVHTLNQIKILREQWVQNANNENVQRQAEVDLEEIITNLLREQAALGDQTALTLEEIIGLRDLRQKLADREVTDEDEITYLLERQEEILTQQARTRENLAEATRRQGQYERGEYEALLAGIAPDARSFGQNVGLGQRTNEVSNLVKGLTSLSFVATSTIGIMRTLSNESISTEQKVSQVFTSIISMAPMVALNIDGIKTALVKTLTLIQGHPVIAALSVLTVVIAKVISHQKELIETQIKINNETIEHVNAVQQEVNANEDLYNSYNKLIAQYEQGLIEKKDLYDATGQLNDAYEVEGSHIANLTGNYEEYTKAIRKARKEELLQAKQNTEAELKAAKGNILLTGRQSDFGRQIGDQYQIGYGAFDLLATAENEEVLKILSEKVEGFNYTEAGSHGLFFSAFTEIDANDIEGIVKQYDDLSAALSTISDDLLDTKAYIIAKQYLSDMKGAVEEYRTALEELDNYNVQLIFADYNFEAIKSFEEYDRIIQSIREQLLTEFNGDSEKVNSLLKTYLKDVDNEFVSIGLGLEEIREEFNLTEETFKDWSESDKKLLLSGKVEIDGLETEEEFRKAINAAKNKLSDEDLTIVVSLRSKLASDKKLTKTQLKEAAGEESTLAEDYEDEMATFDMQSELEQLETLNRIVDDKIAVNRKYITDAKKTAEEEKEVLEIRKANWEKEADALRKKKEADEHHGGKGVLFTEEDKEQLNQLNADIEAASDEIENFQDIIEKGLPIEDLEAYNFDNLTNGIDGVIDKATLLQELAEKVGKSWTIAGDDIASFARNFPDVVAAQENYNILQDGSIQLTKQGQEALQSILGLKQQELELSAEAYQIELQKQVDVQLATAEYYENQAELLRNYLNGQTTAADTETALAQGVTDYKLKLAEITGQSEAELQAAIQQGYDETASVNTFDAQDIYDNYVAIGQVAEAAALAFLNKEFVDPGVRPVKGGGHATSSGTYNQKTKRDVNSGDYLKTLTDEQIQEMIITAENSAQAARDRAGELLSKKLASEAEVVASKKAVSGAISGTGGKDSKSGSSKKDKDKDLKKLDEEFDRYWEIHKALDQLDKDLKKLDKDQENLHGKELIRSLKQENELLSQQADLYKQLATEQQKEAAELRDKLAGSGVTFDASGAIINYAQATAEALQKYNEAVKSYNAGLLDDAAFKIHEKAFEEFKKNLERYDNLFYKEMQETQEKLDEIRRKQLANNLKAWEVEIQLKLDWKQLERDWNDFLTEISEDFKSVFKDLRVDLKSMLTNAGTYTGAEGTIGSIVGAVKDVTGEIDKMMGGGSSSMFESVSQAQEKLKELNSELLDSSKALHDLWKQAWENYLNGIDQVSDAFDKLLDRFERINDELEFQNKLIELLYGDEAYGLMSKLYEGQERNAEVQLQSLKSQVDMWKELFDASGATMENQMEWSEDQQKYYDNWIKAQSSLNDLVIEYIELLKKDYMNTISDILKQFETFVTSGSSLSYIGTQWERISANADKYYDSVEGAYQIQTLANKIDESIANSNTLKVQQKLMALREKEITYLREKETLTEYDIKAAEMRYQIALKEIALEDAQQNKTAMKLTRNEQGNWSYQYVADEQDIATKRQELLDMYNDLYQLASDAYEANLNSLQELQQKYIDSAKEIYENENITEEERQQQLLELREWYLEQYRLLSEENQLYRNDLATSGAALLLEIYEQDQEAYQAMTENERELVDALINANIDDYMELEDKLTDNYQNIGDKAREVMANTRADWTSGAQTIADLWNKNNGWSVKTQVISAYDSIQLANQRYKEAVDWCAAAVERNFGPEGIVGAIQDAEYETDSLRDKTVEMVNTAIPYLQELRSYVDQIEDAWRSVQQAIIDAINLIEEYLRKVGEARAAQEAQIAAANAKNAEIASKGSGGSNGGAGSKNRSYDKPDSEVKYYYSNPSGASGTIAVTDSAGNIQRITTEKELKHKAGWINVNTRQEYATGGYTGTWVNGSTDGRWAVLHQKELVLNENDTKNFLSAINTIRDLNSGLNHSIQDAVLNAVARTAIGMGGLNTSALNGINNSSNSTENVYNITAEFPNAENVNEIREAILSLPNLASQYANSTLK